MSHLKISECYSKPVLKTWLKSKTNVSMNLTFLIKQIQVELSIPTPNTPVHIWRCYIEDLHLMHKICPIFVLRDNFQYETCYPCNLLQLGPGFTARFLTGLHSIYLIFTKHGSWGKLIKLGIWIFHLGSGIVLAIFPLLNLNTSKHCKWTTCMRASQGISQSLQLITNLTAAILSIHMFQITHTNMLH